jgi:formylglycine-generating enzyme required for sulfatase activity
MLITIQTEFSPADGMVMAFIPAGDFEMGSESNYDNEIPVHLEYVPDFWMDETEITNGLYAKCMEAEVCRPPRDMEYISNPSLVDHPVTYVSWDDAVVYCEWVGRRLPSEVMWEKAARGGLIGESFPWGNDDPVCTPGEPNGVFMAGCSEGTGPVKIFEHNAYGLYDMAGNVWEWVEDWYDVYPGGDRDGDMNYGERYKVARGGSFYDDLWDIMVSVRHWVLPSERVDNIGFRCALY